MRKDTVMSQGYQPGNPTWYQMPQGAAPSRPHVPLSRAGRKDINPAAIA